MTDRISNLPDELLTQILSILPMKEAIRTSVLSTRWGSVWTCLPILYMDYDGEMDEHKKEIFCKFVNSALVDHKMRCLEKVKVSYLESIDNLIDSWISAAIDSNISNLWFRAGNAIPFNLELPPTLFSSCNLVQLGLDMTAVIDFPVASTAFFPKLKLLGLYSIVFRLDNDSATNLISSCPVLEVLEIEYYGKSFQTLNVSAVCLKKFTLKQFFSSQDLAEFDYVPKILIDTPALESLHISYSVPHMYQVTDCSSLVEAEICMTAGFSHNHVSSCVLELLNGISNIESLSIAYWTIPTLFDVERSLPRFHNLTSLKFQSGTSRRLKWKMMIAFLKSCPVLEILVINDFAFRHDRPRMDRYNDVPSCLISHLKTLRIFPSIRRGYKMEDIGYFLKNANYLEKMLIIGIKKSSKESEDILSLPRSSPACRIEFL